MKYQFLPRLADDEYQALEASIMEHGVKVPIIVDEDGSIIDGYHRQEITKRHGLACPTIHETDLTETQKRTLALSLNVDRRHLNREQKRGLIERSLLADPNLSDREHAKRTGSTHPTVADVRNELETTGRLESFTSRLSGDGRERPASQPFRESPLSAGESVPASPEAAGSVGDATGDVEPPAPSPVAVNPTTGEIVDAPVVTEHTVTEKTRTVVGLDGKTYEAKPKKPKPVLKDDALARYDAEIASKNIGSALLSLSHMITPAYREEVICRYWPAGNDAVPPDVRALFAPTPIRDIAAALMELAHELEVHQ